jgi:hypothetical protein
MMAEPHFAPVKAVCMDQHAFRQNGRMRDGVAEGAGKGIPRWN